jgi:hypothetical protein
MSTPVTITATLTRTALHAAPPVCRRGCFVSTPGEHNREDGKLTDKIVKKVNK